MMNRLNNLAVCLVCLASVFCFAQSRLASAQQFDLPPAPGTEPFGQPEQSEKGPRIKGCVVQLVTDIQLPATESGSLVHLGVKEGSTVRAEQIVAQIDDRTAQQAFRMAKFGQEAADARAEDDIEIVYSAAAARVARVDWEELVQANLSVSKAVTEADIRRARLDYDRSKLGTDKAKKDKFLAGLDAKVKLAELEAAQIGIEQRQILAPFDGTVVEIFRHQEEWVQAGEPIIRLIRLDTLKVEGYVYFDDYDPSEIDGCEVTVDVSVGKNKTVKATGRVVYIDPEAKYDGRFFYKVQAEIANRQENGRWLISPKLPADMTIHLGTGGVANARR